MPITPDPPLPKAPAPATAKTLINRVLARLAHEADARTRRRSLDAKTGRMVYGGSPHGYTRLLIREVLEDELARWLKERGIEEATR